MKKLSFLLVLLCFVAAGQAQRFQNLDVNHSEPRPDHEVAQLVSSIKGNSFPRQRLQILQEGVSASSLGFTGKQTVQVLSAFATSTEKSEAIQIMDEYILGMNSDNVIEAINTARFSSHKLTILEALRSTITDDDRRYKILDAFKTQVDKKKAKAILDRIVQPRSFIYGTVISKRVVFIVDFSGSMEATFQLSNGQEVSRLDFVRHELEKAVSILPQDIKMDVIMFSTDVNRWKNRLVNASDNAKNSSINFVSRYSPQGGTNIHGALKEAFSDRDVKTIYFLTDGVPTAGEEQSASGIIDEVRRWNSGRDVRVHTCAFLSGSFSGDNKSQSKELMKKLAEATKGVYRAFD